MHRSGPLLLWGPFSGQPDETLRGLCVYGVALDAARQLAGADPIVRRGWLRIVAFRWYTNRGILKFDAHQLEPPAGLSGA